MISLNNIHSFTQFQRNAKTLADQVRETQSPLVLTVNGEASLVIHDAKAFQEMLDHVRKLEEELEAIKLEALRRDVQVGIEQADRGEFSDLSIKDIKAAGRRRLQQEQEKLDV